MPKYEIESLNVVPYFNLENIMEMSKETRIGGEVMDKLIEKWKEWLPHLHARILKTEKISYLLVWLDSTVDENVDALWENSPSQAYLYNSVAQVMCMGTVHQLLPEIEEAGCAPAPRPTDTLIEILSSPDFPSYKGDGPALSARYAVLTHYPFKGSCEICHLQKDCPKGQGHDCTSSVVLPGYE